MSNQAIYPYSGEYARSVGEAELYRASRRENIACKEAIEQAIRENFDGSHLNGDGGREVLADFGADRVQFVLANTLQSKDTDGRFSRDNKEWAQAFLIPEDKDEFSGNRKLEWVVDSHPAVLDGFIKQVRKTIDALVEQPEKKPSIKKQLAAPPTTGDKPAAKSKDREVR